MRPLCRLQKLTREQGIDENRGKCVPRHQPFNPAPRIDEHPHDRQEPDRHVGQVQPLGRQMPLKTRLCDIESSKDEEYNQEYPASSF